MFRLLLTTLVAAMLPIQSEAWYSNSTLALADCSAVIDLVDSNDNGRLDLRSEFTSAIDTLVLINSMTCASFAINKTAILLEEAYTELLSYSANSSTTSTTTYDAVACKSLESVLRRTCLWSRTTFGTADNSTSDKASDDDSTASPTLSPTTMAPSSSPVTIAPSSAPTRTRTQAPTRGARTNRPTRPPRTNAPTKGGDGEDEEVIDVPVNDTAKENVTTSDNLRPASATAATESTVSDSRRRVVGSLGGATGALVLVLLAVAAWKPSRSRDHDKEFDADDDVLGASAFPPPEIQDYECYDEEELQLDTMGTVDGSEEFSVIEIAPSRSRQLSPQIVGTTDLKLGNRSFQLVIHEADEE